MSYYFTENLKQSNTGLRQVVRGGRRGRTADEKSQHGHSAVRQESRHSSTDTGQGLLNLYQRIFLRR